jgi:hypothetical protein
MVVPLCPVVLAILDASPGGTGVVARELARRRVLDASTPQEAATVTLRRLQGAGLIYAGGAGSQQTFRLTRSGRRELEFHRRVSRAYAHSRH